MSLIDLNCGGERIYFRARTSLLPEECLHGYTMHDQEHVELPSTVPANKTDNLERDQENCKGRTEAKADNKLVIQVAVPGAFCNCCSLPQAAVVLCEERWYVPATYSRRGAVQPRLTRSFLCVFFLKSQTARPLISSTISASGKELSILDPRGFRNSRSMPRSVPTTRFASAVLACVQGVPNLSATLRSNRRFHGR
ncbi:unnamed protein product [Sphagnum troendelagicum]|uniref:Uncharacterized protein n=1 Tax=Sphagnum troendelagicum TaxID=128251 RepID=A0ABP0UC12_9BRYO